MDDPAEMPRRARVTRPLLAILLASVPLAFALGGTTTAASGLSQLDVVVFGQGVVQLSPPTAGIDECSSTCEGLSYPDGTGVTLTAVPSGEWTLNGWGSCDEQPSPSECVVYTTEFETRKAEASFVNPPPALPTITFPAESQQIETAGSPVKVEVTFEDGDPTIARYECDLDAAGEPQPCTSPWVLPSVAVGAHTAHVFALDAEGNGSEVPAARHFDVVAPSTGGNGDGGGEPSPATSAADAGDKTGTSPGPVPRTSRPVKLRAIWKVTRRRTGVKSLLVQRLPAGASVRVSCSGSGCPFKSKKAKVSGHRADLTGLFGKHRLLVGDVIRLRVGTETGAQLIEIEIRAGRAPNIVRR